jgi:3-dehydroquinate synthase
VLIVYPQPLATTAEALSENLKDSGFEVLLAEVPAAEDAKRVEVAAFCWQIMGKSDFHRNDAVIGLGGGSTTDLAGFVAATWLRGVRSILIPTTLLGMVDAAIGGKTGINTTEGKNLVGAFYAPHSVVIDLDTLHSLPRNELLAGMAEVVKYGFIADPWILETLENDPAATDPSSSVFEELIRRSVAIKEGVTGRDFTESGEREFLNYGHTLGHAIEHAERYKWRHGAAISIGMVFAAELSMLSGKLSEADVIKHRSVFESLGLPTTYRADRWPQLLDTMQKDKKSRAGSLRFVVLEKIGKPTMLNAPTPELVFTAFQAIVE